jgi:hypothetical protein
MQLTSGDTHLSHCRWTGAVPAGTRLVSHVAVFYIMRDGLVLEQSSYDSCEPIAG